MQPSLESNKGSIPFRRFLFPALLGGIAFGLFQIYAISKKSQSRFELPAESIEEVRLVNLDTSVNAPGDIRSATNTVVECEIERMYVYAAGRAMLNGNSTRILKLIPDGTAVKKGQVICELDSSAYEEAVRLQKINLEQALAMQHYTEMDLEVSQIMLEEYRLGTAKRTSQSLRQQIALARADSMRSSGRLEWSRKMYGKGYVSRSSMRAEELAMQRADIMMSRSQIALETFEKFTKPRTEHSFRSRLMSQNWLLTYYRKNVETQRKQLERYEQQVANCKVRAPHDGIVVYANEEDGDSRIEEGSEIRYKQDIFFLPDLNDMQVLAKLSESVVDRVRAGMKVNVKVQSLSGVELEGTVEQVAKFPIQASSWRTSAEVKNYFCLVKVNNPGLNLRPGMTAEIDVLTEEQEALLAVSPEAVHIEEDHAYCYVVRDDGEIEKREVRVRTADADHVAIMEGLEQGESVIRSPLSRLEQVPPIVKVVSLGDSASANDDRRLLAGFMESVADQNPGDLAKKVEVAGRHDSDSAGY